MSGHTPEPWSVYESTLDGDLWVSISKAGLSVNDEVPAVCMVTHRNTLNQTDIANARRIVACVNACKGIPLEVLEAPGYSVKEELDTLDEQIKGRLENESDMTFLLDRAMQGGKITFGGYRETGISSNSIVAIAYRLIPLCKQELPSDESDLEACRNMWKKLPEHRKSADARAAMQSAESVIAAKYHK